MSKIAIVGCDSSGKTVFISALTEYFKAGQRIGQSCHIRPSNTRTRRYTDGLHYIMRILHKWPEATHSGEDEDDLLRLVWTMVKDGKPLTEIEMLDYGGEDFREAFQDDGTPRNNAAAELLVNYIAEADFVVIMASLERMVRGLTPEVYRDMENGQEMHDRDYDAQWVTLRLLELVRPKLATNPPGVVVALTQADKYRDKLVEYGGARGLFESCWADVAAEYPNLNIVDVASVDKLTAGGFPADDYKTDGVLTVMKEFSRYAFGDCDAVVSRLQNLTSHLCNMTMVRTPKDFHESVVRFESAMKELHDKTAIVQELYKDDFQANERFLARCRLFVESIDETERRPLGTQVSADYWNEQLRQFPEMAGTIRGIAGYYQRKAELIRAEEQRKEQARRRAEEERLRQLQIQEEERRQQARIAEEQRQAALKREEEERERQRRIQEEQERNRRRREEEERRELELQRLKAEEEKARIERERIERRDRTKSFMLRSSIIAIALLLIGTGIGVWHAVEKENQNRATAALEASKRAEREAIAKDTARVQTERAQADAQAAAARQLEAEAKARQAQAEADAQAAEARQREAEAKARQAQAEADVQAATARQKEAEATAKAEAERRAASAAEERRRITAETETLLASLRDAVSDDDLVSSRERIADLKRRGLAPYQKSVVNFCDKFCERLERAQNGDTESMMWIALQHAEQKTTVKQDRKKAAEWYERAANGGNSKAMIKLAHWSAVGMGIPKDEKLAISWYVKAAKAQDGNAMYSLGVFYAQGKMGLEKSTEKAYEMFRNAKSHGCTYTDEKTGVDAWLNATKPIDQQDKPRTYFWSSNKEKVNDLDSILNDLEALSTGR
ncbi:MAG: sel1 repeat family protein [Kiritimatiellae bacterium]|nr:sel1 repeat family protein [Kiritimatiellia bacterium]